MITSNQTWDPHTLTMPGGMPDDLPYAHQSAYAIGTAQNHLCHETDCVAYHTHGMTEQTFIKRLMQSVHVTTMRHMSEIATKTRHSQFTPEHIAAVFNVNLGTTKDILMMTTQRGIRHSIMPLT